MITNNDGAERFATDLLDGESNMQNPINPRDGFMAIGIAHIPARAEGESYEGLEVQGLRIHPHG